MTNYESKLKWIGAERAVDNVLAVFTSDCLWDSPRHGQEIIRLYVKYIVKSQDSVGRSKNLPRRQQR